MREPGSSASDSPEYDELVELIYQRIMGGRAAPAQLERWRASTRNPRALLNLIKTFAAKADAAAGGSVPTTYPAGHYYSPVVDPQSVREYVKREAGVAPEDIAGIDFDLEAMRAFWEENREHIAATPFTEQPDPRNRYSYKAGPYPYGDAITLRAIVGARRPKRIVEIGSGLSTACMLDAADHFGLADLRIICIEPYAGRLRSALRAGDETRVEIIEQPVQQVGLERFRDLTAGDILFIDSTHVLKTGSDVHYELFHILPLLPTGVLVHFHDCRYPFEYPAEFIFEKNYSWNEAYAVRAFLMYNTRFRVFFYNTLFAVKFRDLIASTCPIFLRNPGSSLWLTVQ